MSGCVIPQCPSEQETRQRTLSGVGTGRIHHGVLCAATKSISWASVPNDVAADARREGVRPPQPLNQGTPRSPSKRQPPLGERGGSGNGLGGGLCSTGFIVRGGGAVEAGLHL